MIILKIANGTSRDNNEVFKDIAITFAEMHSFIEAKKHEDTDIFEVHLEDHLIADTIYKMEVKDFL